MSSLETNRNTNAAWRIPGTRVSLDSVVLAHLEGLRAEEIADAFPVLSLEEVHSALAFYLSNKDLVDAHLCEQQERWRALNRESEETNASLLDRLRRRAGEDGVMPVSAETHAA